MPRRSVVRVVWLAAVLALASTTAYAQYATGGSGLHRDTIIWFSWGSPNTVIPQGQTTTVTRQFSVGGQTLEVTCSISSVQSTNGNLVAYRPGDWQGDGLDDLYNIGGTGSSNQLAVGLANGSTTSTISFRYGCSATLGGNPLQLTGLVFADAEQSDNAEYVQARTPTAGTTWRIIDRTRVPDSCTGATATLSEAGGQTTVRISSTGNSCSTGPTAIAFIEGATAADVEFLGGGKSAIALGVVVGGADRGDAPATYGDPTHALQSAWTGGVLGPGSTNVSDPSFTLATLTPPAPRLGTQIDGDPTTVSGAAASGDDNDNLDDEDGLAAGQPGSKFLAAPGPGSQLTISNIACAGSGTLAGWIDFNGNGVFDDATERSVSATCSGPNSSLSWTVPADVVAGPTFLRLRVAASPADVVSAVGAASTGEVEDYPITLVAARFTLVKLIVGRTDAADEFALALAQGTFQTSFSTSGGTSASSPVLNVAAAVPIAFNEAKAGGSTPLHGYLTTVACGAGAGSTGTLASPSLGPGGGTITPNYGNNIICTITNIARPTVTIRKVTPSGAGTFSFTGNNGLSNQSITTTSPGVVTAGARQTLTLHGLTTTITEGVTAGFTLASIDCTGLGSGGTATPNLAARTVTLDAAATSPGSNITCTFRNASPIVDATKTSSPGTVFPNGTITYVIAVTNTGTAPSASTVVRDAIPAGTTYVAGSTTLNGAAVADIAGSSPLVLGMAVSGPGESAGVILPGQSATVRFRVTVDPSTTTDVTNVATIDPDGAGGSLSPFARQVTTTVRPQADLAVTNTGPANVVAGQNVAFAITVANNGPSPAENVSLAAAPPPGSTLVGVSGGGCSSFPCSLATLGATGSITVTATYTVPPGYTAPDPIVSVATVSTSTEDPSSANNSATARTSLAAPIASLSITKTNGTGASVPGTSTTYTIVVGNAGPSTVIGALVTDTVPASLAGITWTCAAAAGASCTAASGTGNIATTVTLPPAATATFAATGTIAPDATGTLVNTATVDPPSGTSSASAAATDIDTLIPTADIAVTISSQPTVVVGGQASYTVTATNNGPSMATGVAIDVPTFPGLTVASVTGACPTLPCAVGTLAPSQASAITVTFNVPPGFQPSVVTAAASATCAEADPIGGNNIAQTQTAVIRDADLRITKSATPATAGIGAGVTFVVTVTNDGPAAATSVSAFDKLPAGLTFTGAVASQGSYAPTSGEWTIGALLSGESAQLTLTATVAQAGTITNLAVITRQSAADPNPGNNSAAAAINLASATDVAITKTVSNLNPTVGESVTFLITAANVGPTAATNVVVADQLPAGLTYVTHTSSAGSYSQATGTWTVGTIAPGASATLSVTVAVGVATPIVNTAARTSQTEPDSNALNDSASVTLNGGGTANLAIVKTVDKPTAAVGSLATFHVAVTNLGPEDATHVVLADSLPAGLTFQSAVMSTGSFVADTGAWSIGTMRSGDTEVLTIAALVTTTGPHLNAVSSQSLDQTDPDVQVPATATVTGVIEADLEIVKTPLTPALAGGAMSYRIVAANHGPSPIAAATVADVFPASIAGVTWTCAASAGSSCPASGSGDLNATVALRPNGTATFVVTGMLPSSASGVLNNVATIAAPGTATDPVSGNNTSSSLLPILQSADVRVVNAGPPTATAGTTLSFTIAVTNAGPSDASGVSVLPVTPTGLTVVAASGACTVLPCLIPSLAAGASQTLTVSYAIPALYTTPDPIVSAVSASSATPDPLAANNSTFASSSLGAPISDLAIVKTNPASPIVPGTSTTYTITVTNAGPAQATNARVTDVLPPALANAAWTCTPAGGAACATASGSGNINQLLLIPPGASVTIGLTADVSADAVGQLDNLATVTPAAGTSDPLSANNAASTSAPLVPSADLSITLTGPGTAVPGNTVAYSAMVANAGPSTALNTVAALPVPPGLTLLSTSGDCATAFPCLLGSIPPGATRTIDAVFRLAVGYVAPDPIAATASVSSTTSDPSSANDTSSVSSALNRNADVAVTTAAPAVPYLVGDHVPFTITVVNNGPNQASGVVVTDRLPQGLTFVSASDPAYDRVSGRWDVGSLPVGVPAQLVLTAGVVESGSIVNVAVKSSQNEPDPARDNDVAAIAINTAVAADLSIATIADRTTVAPGDPVTFTLAVTNLGPSNETAVSVTDLLPAGLTFVGATASSGSYDSGTGVWSIGALAAGAQVQLTLDATTAAATTIVNDATVSGTPGADLFPFNNRAVVVLNGSGSADIGVSKMVSSGAPAIGGHITYTIAVTNNGGGAAAGVVVSDVLPTATSIVTSSPSLGAYDSTSGTWTIGNLAAGQTATLAIDVTVIAAGTPTIDNTASLVSSVPADPHSDNNSNVAQVMPVLIADLAVTKIAPAPSVPAGGPAAWIVAVTNNGPSPAAGATVQDLFPPGYSGVWTCTATAGSTCPASGSGSISTAVDLLAAGTATFNIAGTVAPPATGQLVNAVQVVVPPGTADPMAVNNAAISTVAVVAIADLAITKTADATMVDPSGPVRFTITVVNNGPSPATGIRMQDAVPTSVLAVSASCTVAGTGACGANASAGNLIAFTDGSLAPGVGNALVFTVTGTLSPTATNTLTNTALVSAAGSADLVSANNSSTAAVPIAPIADVQVAKTGPARAAPGMTISYVIDVTNAGPFTASGVRLDDPTPSGLTAAGVTGACSTFPCTLGTMAPGETRTITARYTVPAPFTGTSPVTNRVTVTAATLDLQTLNNSADATTTILPSVGCDVTGDGISEFVTALGAGGPPLVRVWSVAGGTISMAAEFLAYDRGFAGGVRVACADVTGDGVPEIVTGAGPGGGPHVRFWHVASGAVTEVLGHGFFAYDPAFPGGVNLATGDIDGDGVAELITGAGAGGGPHVRVFSALGGTVSERRESGFFAYDPAFPGGVGVSAGDVDGDGIAEIITGAGRGGGPHVRIFSAAGNMLTERAGHGFFAYDPAFPGGVSVAAADVDGDGVAEIVTGAGPGGGPHVRVYSVTGGVLAEPFGQGFFAYHPAFPGGVSVAALDLDGDGREEIVTGAGPGGGPHVRFRGYVNGQLVEYLGEGFFPYDPGFSGGVYVGR